MNAQAQLLAPVVIEWKETADEAQDHARGGYHSRKHPVTYAVGPCQTNTRIPAPRSHSTTPFLEPALELGLQVPSRPPHVLEPRPAVDGLVENLARRNLELRERPESCDQLIR